MNRALRVFALGGPILASPAGTDPRGMQRGTGLAPGPALVFMASISPGSSAPLVTDGDGADAQRRLASADAPLTLATSRDAQVRRIGVLT